VEVKVDVACPAVIVPAGGAMVPFTALKVTGVRGIVPEPEVFTASELNLMSAVTFDVVNGWIALGAAVVRKTIQGS
jgi:hypothetical protein